MKKTTLFMVDPERVIINSEPVFDYKKGTGKMNASFLQADGTYKTTDVDIKITGIITGSPRFKIDTKTGHTTCLNKIKRKKGIGKKGGKKRGR